MADVIPFRGILYNAAKVNGDDVVAPPYDIITPDLRRALYGRSKYNIVRVDFGEECEGDGEAENKYVRAARFLASWRAEGVLVQSDKPCFYAYEMDYRSRGEQKTLTGFFGLVRLRELGNGIFPHEETHSKPKVDRLNLMTACRANTSPIFALYNSPARKASDIVRRITGAVPYLRAADSDGTVHRLWVIGEQADINAIQADLADKAILIADGHHRYETALEYHRTAGKKTGTDQSGHVLMFLANIADSGLTVLPTHRLINYSGPDMLSVLSDFFEVETLPANEDLIRALWSRSRTFGLSRKGDAGQYLLTYRGKELPGLLPVLRDLDVTILHELIFRELLKVTSVRYEMDPALARALVKSGEFDAAFFLNPTRVEDVERVALSSARMPPKSTYFYPKVMTGFVINSLNNTA